MLPPPSNTTRVLVVDDEAPVRDAFRDVLSLDGFEVLAAGSAREALEIVEAARGAVDVLVLDIGLPDADGMDVARATASRFGVRPTLYVTGWLDEFVPLGEAPARWLLMQKPIHPRKLLAAVHWLASGQEGAFTEP